MTDFAFQVPSVILLGGFAFAAVMVWFATRLRSCAMARWRRSALIGLRIAFLSSLLLLLARPVWTAPDQKDVQRNEVALLIDCSQSMSVREGNQTRYEQAVAFARDSILPVLNQSKIHVRPILFSDNAREVTGQEIANTNPDGAATNLGRAIVHGVVAVDPPPLMTIALTDGVLTDPSEQGRAVAALVMHAVPLVGIGFGSQSGGRVVSLESIDAPSVVEPEQTFRVTAKLSATGDAISPLTVLLLHEGQLVERREIDAFKGPRTWLESFDVKGEAEGMRTYTVRVMPPADSSVTIAQAEAATVVRFNSAQEMRVLYVQGGLTWDYKFATIAIRRDPSIRISGLSRTASTSKFFENVQSDVDLVSGFPTTVDQLGQFRVVVLSNLRPGDLTPNQQQLLADYCGALGGGVLMIGGPQTFNASWRESRLEELLPVRFAVLADLGDDQSFRLRPTKSALSHPVFQISGEMSPEEAWLNLPRFTHQAVVDSVKPGAETLLESDSGSVLMATQRYGNGLSAVICMQNLWRWRLARESDTDQFDRFWTQLFRYLAEAGREVYTLTLSDLQPQPGDEVQLLIEHRAVAGEESQSNRRVQLQIQGPNQQDVLNRTIDLDSGRRSSVSFTADSAGLFTATLRSGGNWIMASQEINVRDRAAELAMTSRNMESLRQLADVSGGLAVEAESADNVQGLLERYLDPEEPPVVEVKYAMPAGINGWCLAFLLICICAEWFCRKRWGML